MNLASVFEFFKSKPNIDIFVVRDEKEAQRVADICKFFDIDFILFPDFRAVYGDDLRVYKDELSSLLIALKEFYSSKKLLISPIQTLLNYMPSTQFLQSFKISFGDVINLNSLKEQLLFFGFEFVDIIESKGEVSIRGDIIDIFPINLEKPLRISLFDSDIESIRYFDIDTQKSIKDELETVEIYPRLFSLNRDSYETLQKLSKVGNSFFKDIQSLGFWYLERNINLISNKKIFSIDAIDLNEFYEFNSNLIPKNEIKITQIEEAKSFKELENIKNIDEILDWHANKKITLIYKNIAYIRNIKVEKYKKIEKDIYLNFISKDELILTLHKKTIKNSLKSSKIILDELKIGDFVVHHLYGVGIFCGLSKEPILGAMRDFVLIKYQGDDKLFIPVENLETIDRYIANSGVVPVIDKLGKGSFAKLKEKVREQLIENAKAIIELSAIRESYKGFLIKSNFRELKEFRDSAKFEYTTDQMEAIEEIFKDLSSGSIMDRLLVGDVGFGKTEVAMNAIFATVKSGYQVAMIAPTTLLSNQLYNSIKNRVEKFNIRVAKLDRFIEPKDKKRVLQALKDGTVDVVIGTHSLFGSEFKNLALVIIDEEHKFGVKQKEKLKELSKLTHLLSMSATPIPRTLNMALSSVKTISEIKTAPIERIGVRSFVREYSEALLKEVILKELRRGGQIFYVHNHIATIDERKKEILKVIPNLKIAVLHSQIGSNESEEEMIKFANREYDLLLSTSIIESGLHIPNVNTILIENADRFGIADLHQLRGRVGRGAKEGYCYFLVTDKENLTIDAKKRLQALEGNSHLGSGANLAMLDLEIRGGGNILGEAQSGHIKNVGYSLYLRMLEDAIFELSGKSSKEKKSIDVKLSINAYLSPLLIAEDRIRLELYRRFSKCENIESVKELEGEIIDRFGKLDINTREFVDLVILKIKALAKDIKLITNYNQNITILYHDDKKVIIQAKSKDDDDLIAEIMKFLDKN